MTEEISVKTEPTEVQKKPEEQKPELEPKPEEAKKDTETQTVKQNQPQEKSKSKSPSKGRATRQRRRRPLTGSLNNNRNRNNKGPYTRRHQIHRKFNRFTRRFFNPKRRLQRAQNAFRKSGNQKNRKFSGFKRFNRNRRQNSYHFKPRRNLRLRKVFVGGLPRSMKSRNLYDLFKFEGRLLSAKIVYDRMGYSRGFGLLLFANPRDSWKVIKKWNETYYFGVKIKVTYKRRFKRNQKKNNNQGQNQNQNQNQNQQNQKQGNVNRNRNMGGQLQVRRGGIRGRRGQQQMARNERNERKGSFGNQGSYGRKWNNGRDNRGVRKESLKGTN